MKKTLAIAMNIALVAITAVMLFSLAGCTARANENGKIEAVRIPVQSELKTYSFETFNHENVTIDETNIIFQEACKDAADTPIVPNDAKLIAPGRDFVYFEDNNYYYVEDLANDVVTIARKA